MIPTSFTAFINAKSPERYSKLAWDIKSARKAQSWSEGPIWDDKSNQWIKPTIVRETIDNSPFRSVKISNHVFDSKKSVCWVEPDKANLFMIEIDTVDLMELIKSNGVNLGGIISGDLQFVVINNKRIKLLDRNSKEYLELVQTLQVKGFKDTFSMSKLEVGGVYLEKELDSRAFVYCGKYIGIEHKWSTAKLGRATSLVKKHVFLSISVPRDPLKVLDAVVAELNSPNTLFIDAVSSSKQLRKQSGNVKMDLNPLLMKMKVKEIDAIINRGPRTFPRESCNKYNMFSSTISSGARVKIPLSVSVNFKDFFSHYQTIGKVTEFVDYTQHTEL